MVNLNKAIVKYIILAQIASDAGKQFRDSSWDSVKNVLISKYPELKNSISLAVRKNYIAKDSYILKAINLINHSNKTGFSYYIKEIEHCKFIIYFNFKINNKKYQMSYHSFSGTYYRFFKKSNNIHCTRWIDDISCRETAILLAEYLFK